MLDYHLEATTKQKTKDKTKDNLDSRSESNRAGFVRAAACPYKAMHDRITPRSSLYFRDYACCKRSGPSSFV